MNCRLCKTTNQSNRSVILSELVQENIMSVQVLHCTGGLKHNSLEVDRSQVD